MYDLIAQGATFLAVVYIGWHLRQKLQTVQATVAAQEKTIAAQAEQMKAQSTVLQDFERLHQTMKLVIDTVSDPATLQREQAYRQRVERDAADLIERQRDLAVEFANRSQLDLLKQIFLFIARLLPFVYPGLRQALVEAADLHPAFKDTLRALARDASYLPITDEASLAVFRQSPSSPGYGMAPGYWLAPRPEQTACEEPSSP